MYRHWPVVAGPSLKVELAEGVHLLLTGSIDRERTSLETKNVEPAPVTGTSRVPAPSPAARRCVATAAIEEKALVPRAMSSRRPIDIERWNVFAPREMRER